MVTVENFSSVLVKQETRDIPKADYMCLFAKIIA